MNFEFYIPLAEKYWFSQLQTTNSSITLVSLLPFFKVNEVNYLSPIFSSKKQKKTGGTNICWTLILVGALHTRHLHLNHQQPTKIGLFPILWGEIALLNNLSKVTQLVRSHDGNWWVLSSFKSYALSTPLLFYLWVNQCVYSRVKPFCLTLAQ